jgi:lysophospholipase L1-like esterase
MKKKVYQPSIMKLLYVACTLMLLSFILPPRKMSIYLVGDSTMADKQVKAYPETGWGMIFSKFFDTTSTAVYNHAQNGRSTQSFLDENRWTPILDNLHDGDIVLVQFGHNDEVKTKATFTTEKQFQANLLKYVTESRAKGAIPVLITPVARRRFDSSGKVQGTHQVYSELVREVAKQNNVLLIDLDVKSQQMLQTFGAENSKWLFNHLKAGEHPNYPEGKADDTHFSELGARKVAEIVYAEINKLNPGNISAHFFKPTPKK